MIRLGGAGRGPCFALPLLLLSLLVGCDRPDPVTLAPNGGPGEAAFLEVTPGTANIPLAGQTVKLEAVVRDARGRRIPQALVLWETDSPEVAMVNADGTVTGLDVGSAQIVARAGSLSGKAVVNVADTPYPISPKRLQIVPSGDTIPQVGGTVQLHATGYDAQNRAIPNPSVAWFSLDPLVASVVEGKITARAKGAARILITNGSLTDTALVWVQPTLPVAGVRITADEDTLYALGDSVKVRPVALDADGNPIPGETLTLTVLDPAVASVDNQANLIAMGMGTVRVTANYGKKADTTTVTVAAAPSGTTTLSISPKVDTIPQVGESTQLAVTTSSTAKVKWQSLDPYAIITGPGTLSGVRRGRARIVAKAGSLADTAIVWIAPADPEASPAAIEITPAADTVDIVGGTVQLIALVVDEQKSPVQDQTVVWTTPDPGIVQVSLTGTVTGLAKGFAAVIATAGALADTAKIWVAPVAVPTDLRIDPARDTIAEVGSSITLAATAVDSDNNVISPAEAVWQSLDPSIAEVAAPNTPAENMLVTARARGVARIIAAQQQMIDTAWITVEQAPAPAQPSSVRVTPRADTIPTIGGTLQLTAAVLDQSGTPIQGLTVAWQPLDPAIGVVDASGLVTALASGTARVRAQYGTLYDTATITVAATAPPTTKSYPLPTSIDSTGTLDVTDAILKFVAGVPNGSTILFRRGAKYRIEGTLYVDQRSNLTFEGNSATLIQLTDGATATPWPGASLSNWPRQRSFWQLHRSTGITIRNLSMIGANANGGQSDEAYRSAFEAQHGVNVGSQSADILLQDLNISYVYGDFIRMGGQSRRIVIRGGVWSHNGRQGLGVVDAEDVLVENISMTETRRASIDLEPTSINDIIRRVTIRNSFFGPGRLRFVASGGARGTVEDITIENNTLTRPMSVSILPPEGTNPNNPAATEKRRKNFRFIGNTAPVGGWDVRLVDGFVAHRNTIPRPNGTPGITFYKVCGIDVSPGQFIGANPETINTTPTFPCGT